MTRHHNDNRVSPARLADGATAGIESLRQLAIGKYLAGPYLQECPPDTLLKCGPGEGKRGTLKIAG